MAALREIAKCNSTDIRDASPEVAQLLKNSIFARRDKKDLKGPWQFLEGQKLRYVFVYF